MGYRIKKRGRYYWLFGRVKGIRLDSSLRTTSKKEAEELAKEKVRRALARAHGVQTIRDIRLGSLFEKYDAYCANNNRPSTRTRKGFSLRTLLAYFGDVYVSALTPARVEAFKASRLKDVKPATVNRDLATLKHVLSLAVLWGHLETSPAARVATLKEPPGRLRYLSQAEADNLVAACSKELRPVVVVALHTGLRLGELLALEWKYVDFKRRQLRIVDSKTHESRVVPLNDVSYNTLRRIRGRRGPVFLSRFKRRYQDIRTAFAGALKRAAITDFTFHDLRHTFASWLAMEGVSLSTIGQLLGQKTPEMTLRYAHLAPDYLADVVALLTQNKHKARRLKTGVP